MGYHVVVSLRWHNKDMGHHLIIASRPHLGRGRFVPRDPLFHTTVKTRMDQLDYKPRARYVKGTEIYVS